MRTIRRLVPAVILICGIVLVAGCSGDDDNNNSGGTANSTINIVNGAFNAGMAAFNPPRDTVQVGQTVRMFNGDSITHNIQPAPGNSTGFPSWGSLPANTGVTITANAAGSFDYHCIISGHNMTGTLVVLP